MSDGKYAYRFTGFAMKKPAIQCSLVGVGVITLAGNTISGFHTAAFTPVTDCYEVTPGHFTLSGTFGPRAGGNGPEDCEAQITFTQQEKDGTGKPLQILAATFAMVPAGGVDGFWLISTDTRHKD